MHAVQNEAEDVLLQAISSFQSYLQGHISTAVSTTAIPRNNELKYYSHTI